MIATVVNVGLLDISEQLHPSGTQLLWIVDLYSPIIAGPLIGGWLLEHHRWGPSLLIKLPITAVLVGCPPAAAESRDSKPARFDPISAALSILAVIGLIYAAKDAAIGGASKHSLLAATMGMAAAGTFIRRQCTRVNRLLDLSLLRRPGLATARATALLAICAQAGIFFFGTQYLQLVLGLSPAQAGLIMLPGALAGVVGPLAVSTLARRSSTRFALTAPSVLLAVGGALAVTATGTGHGAVSYLTGFAMIGLGIGATLTFASNIVVGAVDPSRAAAASALSETAIAFGTALGVALLGSVSVAVYRTNLDITGLTNPQIHLIREGIGSATQLESRISDFPNQMASTVRSAFDGLHAASVVATALLAATAAIGYWLRIGSAQAGA